MKKFILIIAFLFTCSWVDAQTYLQENFDTEIPASWTVTDEGGAKKAGLKSGDIILKVNNSKISKFSELRGQLTAKRPGETVNITINRNGESLIKNVKLGKKVSFVSNSINVILKDISKNDKKKFNISNGVKIIKNGNKNLIYYGVKEGFIITQINKKPVSNAQEASRILDDSLGNGKVLFIEGITVEGERERYVFR